MFRSSPKRIYDWEDPLVVLAAGAHSFPLAQPPAVAPLEPPAFVLARHAVARPTLPIFVLPEWPALAVPEFHPSSRLAKSHPHRRPLRWERARRPGSIPHPPAVCDWTSPKR